MTPSESPSPAAAPDVAIVVPCYDEAARLPVEGLRRALAEFPRLALVFVDDGSRDATAAVLERVREGNEARVAIRRLPENRGKGEAVREGLLLSLSRSPKPAFTGYFDADLATPIASAFDMVAVLEREPSLLLVLGSRKRTPGSDIRRHLLRHLPGRLVAWRIRRTLGLPIHDPQCGAKILRVTDLLPPLLASPFETRWLFDVEILARIVRLHREGRLPAPESVVREFPLPRWTDVPGSKVSPLDFFRAFAALKRIRRWLRAPSTDAAT